MKILAVDDDPIILELLSHFIEGMTDHTLVTAECAADALEAIKDNARAPFDSFLLDIQMPVMDGHEATRRIREMSHYASLPIVAVTAHAFAEERDRCAESGMDDFLAKPMKPAALYELLERWSLTSSHRETRTDGDFLSSDRVGQDLHGAGDALEKAANGQSDSRPNGSGTKAAPSHPRRRKSDPSTSLSHSRRGDDEVPVDIEGFRALMRSGGIEEIVEPTLDLYRQEAPGVVNRMREAYAVDDAEGVSSAAHKLKSSSANIRADSFAALLFRLESAGREADHERIAELMPDIESEFEAVMGYLGEHVTA